jgi:hypothetical protein
MTKCSLFLAGISIVCTLAITTASHAIPAFNGLSTNPATSSIAFQQVLLPNQKQLKFKSAGDVALTQKTTNSNKNPKPSPSNFLTPSECRGSSRRQAKSDYPMLDFRFWISDEPCHKSKIDQD